jgi:hypothetical protein
LIAVSEWKDVTGTRDTPRMIQLHLFHDAPFDPAKDNFAGRGWNWPLQQSFYFPGADIAYMDVRGLQAKCGFTLPMPPVTYDGTAISYNNPSGTQLNYDVDLQKLFKCASNLGLFREPMPTTSNIKIKGVHWALEGAGLNGWLWTSVHNMQMHN